MSTPAKISRPEDPRVTFDTLHAWQKDKYPLLGSRYELIDSNLRLEPQPSVLEFDLPGSAVVLGGPMTRFVIRGGFETRTAVQGVWGAWAPTEGGEAARVVLAPNWFEMLVKQIDVFCNNTRITSSNEARSVTPFLNAFLYRLMDPLAKNMMCPQPHHFAHCVPPWTAQRWGAVENTHGRTWLDYGSKVMVNKQGGHVFDYQPLFTFPLHQGGPGEPKMLPTLMTGRVQIRITFHDSQAHIFRKVAGNTDEYRFTFMNFHLILEEARLSVPAEKSLLASKRVLPYPGVTRLQQIDPVPEGATTFKTRFQDVYFPEALLIFALPKEVASGTFKFGDSTSQNVFEEHRIKLVQVTFDHKRLFLREPHPGEVNQPWFETKQYVDHIVHPICGLPVDARNLKPEHFIQGGNATSYPHIYLPLVNYGTKNRIHPAADLDGTSSVKRADLDVELQFGENGAKANLIYVTYAIYTDVGVTYDTRTRLFANPYNIIIN